MGKAVPKDLKQSATREAEQWLAQTELADSAVALTRLSRATHPHLYGFGKREPLTLPELKSDTAARVIWLLTAGQTPTPSAVDHLTVIPDPSKRKRLSPSKQAKRDAWFDKWRQAKVTASDGAEELGEHLADLVADYWREHGMGPHWRDVLDSPQVMRWWSTATGMSYMVRTVRESFMHSARRAGWIAFNMRERSLCPGRLFHTRGTNGVVSAAGPHDIGYYTATYVGDFRDAAGRSPDLAQLAGEATDPDGAPLFRDAEDAAAQLQWLSTHGWLIVRDGTLRRGTRAKMEARRRTARGTRPEAASPQP